MFGVLGSIRCSKLMAAGQLGMSFICVKKEEILFYRHKF